MENPERRRSPKLRDHIMLTKEIPLWGLLVSFFIGASNVVVLVWMTAVVVQDVQQHTEDIRLLKLFDGSVIELMHVQSEKIITQAQINVSHGESLKDSADRLRAIENRLMSNAK